MTKAVDVRTQLDYDLKYARDSFSLLSKRLERIRGCMNKMTDKEVIAFLAVINDWEWDVVMDQQAKAYEKLFKLNDVFHYDMEPGGVHYEG